MKKNNNNKNNQIKKTAEVFFVEEKKEKFETNQKKDIYFSKKKEEVYDNTSKQFKIIDKNNYKSYVYQKSPKSSHFKNMFWAFVIGGLICSIGQGFIELYKTLDFTQEEASVLASTTLVVLTAIFTGLGIYDLLGRFAGAGSTIPITGFSNAVVAPALEFRSEGMIYGLGAKMFLIAGPVIVNGVAISVLIALIKLVIGAI